MSEAVRTFRVGDQVLSKTQPRKRWRITRIEGDLVYVVEVEKTTPRGSGQRTFKHHAIKHAPLPPA